MKILVIEDYVLLRKSLHQGLTEAGFTVDTAADGQYGIEKSDIVPYDIIVLDLMLPRVDGLSVLRHLRQTGNPAHVLILTAKDQISDRVRGLNMGADDYLVKPFAFEELVARINAFVRRQFDVKSPLVTVDDLEIDTVARRVRRGGEEIILSAREYKILEILALRSGHVVTRSEILDHIYELSHEPESNVIDVYVGYLRKKMENNGRGRLLHTRRGLGYVLQGTQ